MATPAIIPTALHLQTLLQGEKSTESVLRGVRVQPQAAVSWPTQLTLLWCSAFPVPSCVCPGPLPLYWDQYLFSSVVRQFRELNKQKIFFSFFFLHHCSPNFISIDSPKSQIDASAGTRQGVENYSKTNLNKTSCQYKLISDTGGIHPPGRQVKKGHFIESDVDETLRLSGCLLRPLPFTHIHASKCLKPWEVMHVYYHH